MNRFAQEVRYYTKSNSVKVTFSTGEKFLFPVIFMRAFSPSADTKGKTLPIDPALKILTIESVGNYAIKPHFSDGHNTGIYSWEYLYQLGTKQDEYWGAYNTALEKIDEKS